MENIIRLNKFIAANGISSRRKVDEMITQGRVTVNGETISELGHKINPDTDKIGLDGEIIKTSTKKIYIILNKPKGVITTVSDDKHRETVIDIINIKDKIFPVGRLDYNTSGLLFLTNDGELANKLMHPKSEVYKTYFVTLSKPLEEKHRLRLEGGIELEGKKTADCKIRFEKKTDYQTLYISIYEGRNRQVRRMFEHYGYFVRELDRTEYAGLKLGSLRPGEWRNLSPDEVEKLNEIVKETPAGTLSNSHYKKEAAAPRETRVRYSYDRKSPRRDFEKTDKGSDRRPEKKEFKKFDKQTDGPTEKKEFKKFEKRTEGPPEKKEFKKFDKRSEKENPRSGFKKSYGHSERKVSKWGFKKKQTDERDMKLGFTKPEKSDDKKFEKRDYKKFGKSDDNKFQNRDSKKFGTNDDKKFGKSVDKKFEKRDYRKSGTGDDKKFEKREYKKFGSSDDKKYEKRDFSKSGSGDGKKYVKRDFKKTGRVNFKKR